MGADKHWLYLARLLILATCYPPIVNGVYFVIGEKETKCLFDDFPEDSITTLRYNATADSGRAIGLQIKVYDPRGKIMVSKDCGMQSSVSFTTHAPGDHAICASTNSTTWGIYATGTMKVEFAIESQGGVRSGQEEDDEEEDEKDDNGPESKEDDKISLLENRIKELMNSVLRVSKGQQQFRRLESEFRRMAETVNNRVLTWGFVQFSILLATGWWQMHSLRSFFIRKKLV